VLNLWRFFSYFYYFLEVVKVLDVAAIVPAEEAAIYYLFLIVHYVDHSVNPAGIID
jgi:hypothetical protein